MPYTDLFSIASWLLIALAVVPGMVAARAKTLHTPVRTACIVVSIGLLLISLAVLVALFRASTLMVADEYVFLIAIGVMLALLRPPRTRAIWRLAAVVIG